MIQMEKTQNIETLLKGIDSLKEKVFQNNVTSPNYIKDENKKRTSLNLETAVEKKKIGVIRDKQDGELPSHSKNDENINNDSDQISHIEADNPNISLEVIKQNWQRLVDEVKGKKIAWGAFLAEGTPQKFQNNILTVVFGMENGFHVKTLERNSNFLEEVTGDVFGANIKIKYIKSKQTNFKNSSQSNSFEERLGKKIPVIKTIVDIFDGEIVK